MYLTDAKMSNNLTLIAQEIMYEWKEYLWRFTLLSTEDSNMLFLEDVTALYCNFTKDDTVIY